MFVESMKCKITYFAVININSQFLDFFHYIDIKENAAMPNFLNKKTFDENQ